MALARGLKKAVEYESESNEHPSWSMQNNSQELGKLNGGTKNPRKNWDYRDQQEYLEESGRAQETSCQMKSSENY